MCAEFSEFSKSHHYQKTTINATLIEVYEGPHTMDKLSLLIAMKFMAMLLSLLSSNVRENSIRWCQETTGRVGRGRGTSGVNGNRYLTRASDGNVLFITTTSNVPVPSGHYSW